MLILSKWLNLKEIFKKFVWFKNEKELDIWVLSEVDVRRFWGKSLLIVLVEVRFWVYLCYGIWIYKNLDLKELFFEWRCGI